MNGPEQRKRKVDVKRIAEEWKIWDENNEVAKLPAGILTIVLHNVIYVPSLKVNLVSLGALYREDVSI